MFLHIGHFNKSIIGISFFSFEGLFALFLMGLDGVLALE
jgi:hypothetical protein